MNKLEQYNNLNEKTRFFNCKTIETIEDFNNIYQTYMSPPKEQKYVFRAVNEARYKIYSSMQRHYIETLSNQSLIQPMANYIEQSIGMVRANKGLMSYLNINNYTVNDFFILALLQHYGKPSPLIDFTYNLNTALFFAFDKMNTKNNNDNISNYVSLYAIDYSQPCFCSMQSVDTNGAENLDEQLRSLLATDKDIKISDINTESVRNTFVNHPYKEYKDIPYILINGNLITNIKITTLDFSTSYNITNPNQWAQHGLFILNTIDNLPLAELLKTRPQFVNPLIDCVNINKNLKENIIKQYKIPNRDSVYSCDDISTKIKELLKTT